MEMESDAQISSVRSKPIEEFAWSKAKQTARAQQNHTVGVCERGSVGCPGSRGAWPGLERDWGQKG